MHAPNRDLQKAAIDGGVRIALNAHDSGHKHVVGRGGLCRRHPEPPGTLQHLHRRERAGACAGHEARRVEGTHRAGRRHRADGQGSPRRQRREPVRRRRSRCSPTAWWNTMASPCSRSPPTPWRSPRRRRAGRRRIRGPAGAAHDRPGLEAKSFLEPPYTMRAAMPRRPSRRPRASRGPHLHRRPGALLPGRAGRLCRAGRGRRRDGPLLLPASRARSSTRSRTCWACRATPSRSRCAAWVAASVARRARAICRRPPRRWSPS